MTFLLSLSSDVSRALEILIFFTQGIRHEKAELLRRRRGISKMASSVTTLAKKKKKKKLSESPYFSLVGLSLVQSLRDLIEARFDCF